MNWLSILIPAHNVEPYLETCVQSIMQQIEDDFGIELLLLDDASTDGSLQVAQALARRWPRRLHLLQQEGNGGLSAARNRLLEAASGDYIWFIDSDDKLLANAIASLRHIVQADEPDLVLCDFQVWRQRMRLKHRLRGEGHRRTFEGRADCLIRDRSEFLSGLLQAGQFHVWTKITRRCLWQAEPDGSVITFPLGRYFEDMTTVPQLALRAESAYHEPRPWVAYRQRPGSLLASLDAEKLRDQSSALREFARRLRHDPCRDSEKVRTSLAHVAARNLVGCMRQIGRRPELGQHGDGQPSLGAQFRHDFLEISPLQPEALLDWYRQQGWWLRRRRFRHAWQQALAFD